jgi:hypothetical protein
VAKRFTDTEKWKKDWWHDIGSQGRDLWHYLYDNCDSAGIFEFSARRIQFDLGFPVNLALIVRVLGGKVVDLGNGRLFFPAFVEFQYGRLSDDCRPHQKIIRTLERRGIDPNTLKVLIGYPKGIGTLEDKDKEKEQEKDKEKEQEKDKEKEQEGDGVTTEAVNPARVPTRPPTGASQKMCEAVWVESLAAMGHVRSLTSQEQRLIFMALRRETPETVQQALLGARYEPKIADSDWDPARAPDIARILGDPNDHRKPSSVAKFVGYALKRETKPKSFLERRAEEERMRQQQPQEDLNAIP